MSKVTLIGGGGARTPLLIHGLAQAQRLLRIRELALYDVSPQNAQLMAEMGREIVRANSAGIEITTPDTLEQAIEGARFVLSSIRVGGIEARARDERIVIDHGMTGQETTGPGGLAMALRTVPVALQHARLIEQYAPKAWLINFTNPAGLITQALVTHTAVKVIGICDTPAELFHRTAWSLGLPFEDLEFQYSGLNHLGWVQRVLLRGEDITERVVSDPETLSKIYAAPLFEPEMIRTLGLLPSEYLFFSYAKTRAFENQRKAGASRGEEIAKMNASLYARLMTEVSLGQSARAVGIYKDYLNQRNASYLQLESRAGSAFTEGQHDWDPFEGATGYHKIAIDVMTALSSEQPRQVVVNVRNQGAIDDIQPSDVVEVPCMINSKGPEPRKVGPLPDSVRGLTMAVKAYERLAIRAAVERSLNLAKLSLTVYPIVGEWGPASDVMEALVDADPEHLGYLK